MDNELILIPKFKTYMKYILKMLIKLPRTEKYSIGTEYKTCVYETLEDIMMLSKIGKEEKRRAKRKIKEREKKKIKGKGKKEKQERR